MVKGHVSLAGSGVPERLGRYEILTPLGVGGMAAVFLARTPVIDDLHREVAVKLMHAHLRADPDWADGLLHEARLAARIRHLNVVSVLEVIDDPMGIFLVMDFVDGDSLAGLIKAQTGGDPLPGPIAGRIVCDALAGLQAAHELRDGQDRPVGLIHRDFSPQNILVGTDGVTRLTDFGIAKATHQSHTESSVAKGKVRYMAPEQLHGEPLDGRCDVWAAGVVAWELLSGRKLIDNSHDISALHDVVSRGPPPVGSVRADIPTALERVVAAALTVDRDRRWATVSELRAQWMAAFRHHGGLAELQQVADFVRETTRDMRRRRKEHVRTVLAERSRSGGTPAIAPQRSRSGGTPAMAPERDAESPRRPAPTSSDATSVGLGVSRPEATPVSASSALDRVGGASSTEVGRTQHGSKLRRGGLGLSVLGAAALVAVLVVVVIPALGTTSDESTTSSEMENEKRGKEEPAATTAPSAREQRARRERLVVQGNAPIKQLQLGDRIVAASGRNRLDIALAPAEQEALLEVSATSVDGRKAEAVAAPSEDVLTLAFPEPSRRPARRQPRRPKTNGKIPPQGLHPMDGP